MSAYLQFFQLERSPFDMSAQSGIVLGTQALRDAFAAIERGLEEGSPRICVNGKSGLGKTSLARSLPKLLAESTRVVVLLNPSLSWRTLRTAIVKQLGLEGGLLSRTSLAAAAREGRRLVVAIDRAETISRDSLEHLDILLQYRGDDDRQLVHCVMLANLEAASAGDQECPLLWWLDQLTTLQLEFAPIPAAGVASYIQKHLKRAGWKGGRLFSEEAAQAIHRLTGGVPRAVSEMCDRVLAAAAERGSQAIDAALIDEVGSDPSPPRETPARPDLASPPELPPQLPPQLERPQQAPSFVASVPRSKPDPPAPPRPLGAPVHAPVEAPISLDSFFGGSAPEYVEDDDDMEREPKTAIADAEGAPGHRWGIWAAGLACLLALAAAGFYLLRPAADAPAPVQARTAPIAPMPSSAVPQRVLARKKPPVETSLDIDPIGEDEVGLSLPTTPDAPAPAAEAESVVSASTPRLKEPASPSESELRPAAAPARPQAAPPASPMPSPAETAINERHW
jgi:type II secretory pathway predicted ATPase ExeA